MQFCHNIGKKGCEKMKKFLGGFVIGTMFTTTLLVGLAYGVKKTVVAPIEEKEHKIDENRKKAARKSFAR